MFLLKMSMYLILYDIVTIPTQPQLNSTLHNKSWVWHKNDFTPPTPTTHHWELNFSCYWYDFDQSFKVGVSDQQQQHKQEQEQEQEQEQQQEQQQQQQQQQ